MRLSRRELLTLGGFAVAGTTLAPSLTRAQTPKRGGTLTIRAWDPPFFDPMLTTAYRVHIPLTFTHSRLVKHKAGPSIVPGTFAIEGDLPSRGRSRTRPRGSSSSTVACDGTTSRR